MKKLHTFLTITLTALLAVSCQQEDLASRRGYLRVEVGTNTYVSTRMADNYDPEQIALQIVNSSGEVVESTDDWTTLQGTQIELVPGTYTVQASSNGFDGMESGFDIPYYAGSTQINVEASKEVTASVECTLANVKVTVNFDANLTGLYQSISTTVSSAMEGINPLNFVMGDELKPAYFPVADLTATLSVTNLDGETHTLETPITDVEARHHYVLHYKAAEEGTLGGVSVSVNGDETIYKFEFKANTQTETSLIVTTANAWSNFAYIEGSAFTGGEETLDNDYMYFEYQTMGASDWLRVAAPCTSEDETNKTYKMTLTELTPGTAYNYRMVYDSGTTTYTSNSVAFTTENATVLPNGNMDDWYQSGRTWYPTSEAYYTANGGSFWDSSNPGTTTGAGALVNANPTQGNSSITHSNGMSAELKSQYASAFGIGKFAAASLYTGKFNDLVGTNGAKIDFGQKFDSRPSALHVWYRYTSGKIDYRGDNTPDGVALKGSDDLCSIYIAIAKEVRQIDNTNTKTFPIDFENEDNIIAYAELPDADAVSTNNTWKEATLALKYKDITPQDEYYLIVVCSASKYGDYFTGSTGSTLYIDDMELIYEQPTVE